ncbi:pro-cathepsin H isoform X2 [Microtus ochrogaster]|uniref:Pro-cathepsin H isoform X2 n=1 Tax=Microtus ochrogaster TaxID=79684 RepID=A0ABM1US37_MICOH|nr:pro-cathepsin H isoform X2 [Microtus ochrogaster]
MWAALSLLCAGAWLLSARATAELTVNAIEKFHFKSWMTQHQKTYSSVEYNYRLHTFANNWRKIQAHNQRNHTFKMGLNQFSDMSFAEIKRKYLWSEPQNCSATKSNYLRGTGPYPSSMDWRKKGNFVSAVKNQGSCGSCWTFSTTGALESAVAIATGKMLSLAEQQLVDCAQNFNNHGCQGGLPSQAFEYILYNKGIMGEDTYPYRGRDPPTSTQLALFLPDSVGSPRVTTPSRVWSPFFRKHLAGLTLGLSEQLSLCTYLGQSTMEAPGISLPTGQSFPSLYPQFRGPGNQVPSPHF